MKKPFLFLAVIVVISASGAEAKLVNEMNTQKALAKFSRGVTNVATSPGEFLTQMPAAMESSPDYLTGFIKSLGMGLGHTLKRFGSGVCDIATFPFPGKTNYKPTVEPETIADPVAETTISRTIS